MERNKIHLVCSAGGVKCFSYIGVIKQIYQAGITVESISACSMGTVIGALIASGKEINELEEKILSFDLSMLNRNKKILGCFRAFIPPFASHNTPDYEKIILDLLGEDLTLSQLKIPFSALALDIRQNRFLVYSSESHPNMKISEVIKIATSIPFMYSPYKINKRLLVDAAVATKSPVWMAVNQKGNFPIIVFKINEEIRDSFKSNFANYLTNLINVSAESHDYFAASQISRVIDIIVNCENIGYADFHITREQIENLFLQGEKAAEQQLKEYKFNFDNILNHTVSIPIEEITLSNHKENGLKDHSASAVNVAENMIQGFKNEIQNRSQVFVSYSHKDIEWLEKFNIHLNAMERFAGIKAWNDKLILTGEQWNNEISKGLSSAKVAVFLVTPHFLDSKFIQEIEMAYFLKINESQKIPIVWIAVSHCIHDKTPLNNIQCANDPQKPLDTLPVAEQNKQFAEICREIIKLMK